MQDVCSKKVTSDAKNFYDIDTPGISIESGKKKLMVSNTEIVQNNDALKQLPKKMKKSIEEKSST